MSRARRRGSTIIEFTLIAVMLLLVMFFAIELDRMLYVYTCLADAAKAGARYAITHGSNRSGSGWTGPSGPGNDPPEVVTAVRNYASQLIASDRLTVSVTYPDGTNDSGGRVKVMVQYSYDPYTRLPLNVTLSAISHGVITF